MDALVQFFTTVAVVMATSALSHFGMTAEGLNSRSEKGQAERSVKRSPTPQSYVSLRLPR